MPIKDQRIRKSNVGYLPSEGENLTAWVDRLKLIKDALRYGGDNQLHIEKFWCHINPRSSSCWVCDLMDILDYIIGIAEDITKYDKKHKWKCYRTSDSKDPYSYSFKPVHINKPA